MLVDCLNKPGQLRGLRLPESYNPYATGLRPCNPFGITWAKLDLQEDQTQGGSTSWWSWINLPFSASLAQSGWSRAILT